MTESAFGSSGERPVEDLAGRSRWIGRDPLAVEEVEPRYLDDRPGITLDLLPPDIMRVEIERRGPVVRAEMIATARGLFRSWIDGERIGDDELAPGWTDYRVRVPVRRYDVTALLGAATERVCWSASVADGWYCGYVGMDRRRQARWYGSAPAWRAVMRILYEDGAEQVVGTDATWRRSVGAVRYADLLMGQMTDGTAEPRAWRHCGFDDAAWSPVVELADDDVVFCEAVDPPVRVIDVVSPVRAWNDPHGRVVLDFGANVVGRLRIDTTGLPAGTRLHARHGEEVVGDEVYTDNLRTARAHDIFVVGEHDEQLEPAFTFHGFRYAEIAGHPGPAGAVAASIRAVVLASDMAVTGSFDCSDEATNRLHGNVLRTIRGNTVALPTDCPQRDERLGWMADAQLIAPTTAHVFDTGGFVEQWLLAVRDGQSANGAFPDVAPRLVVDVDGAPGWADAGVLVPWAQFRHDGDRRRLRRHYPAMVRFMNWLEATNPDLIRRRSVQHNYGDWLSLGEPIDKAILATAYWYYDAIVMTAMAGALDLADDAARWTALAGRLRGAFAGEFVGDADVLRLRGQTPLSMALALDLVPHALRTECVERLVDEIGAAGGALATGIHGTRFVLPALCDAGRVDVAYALLKRREYPSWQFSIDQGATTIWERWDAATIEHGLQTPALNSMNHPALGSVAEWLHCYVAGLRPGCGRLEVRPYPGGGLTRAATTTRLGGRLAAVEWSIDGDVFSVSCTVPQDVDATIFVPATTPGPSHRDGWDVYRRGPGDWEFEAAWTPAEWRPADVGPGVLYGSSV